MGNMTIHLVIWAVLATGVVFLALYHRRLSGKSGDTVSMINVDSAVLAAQSQVVKKLEKVDLWGKILTVIVVLYALAIAGMYLYKMFTDTTIRMS